MLPNPLDSLHAARQNSSTRNVARALNDVIRHGGEITGFTPSYAAFTEKTAKTTEKEQVVFQYSYLSSLRTAKTRRAARLPETASGVPMKLV